MKARLTHHYGGWRPDHPDHRDLHYAAPPRLALALPPSVDQRATHPPIVDQQALGSCTSQAGTDIVEYLIKNGMHVQVQEEWQPLSRLALYYDERVIEGTTGYDAGAEIRDTLKVIAKTGVGTEALCPYDISKFTKKPSPEYYADAANRQGLVYSRVAQNECVMKGVLAQGLPIIVGFTVWDSFESAEVSATGIVPMPGRGESVLGGHAVVAVGYTDEQLDSIPPRHWIMRNSWGTGWGMSGYFAFPYEYLLNPDMSSDFWVLSSVE